MTDLVTMVFVEQPLASPGSANYVDVKWGFGKWVDFARGGYNML